MGNFPHRLNKKSLENCFSEITYQTIEGKKKNIYSETTFSHLQKSLNFWEWGIFKKEKKPYFFFFDPLHSFFFYTLVAFYWKKKKSRKFECASIFVKCWITYLFQFRSHLLDDKDHRKQKAQASWECPTTSERLGEFPISLLHIWSRRERGLGPTWQWKWFPLASSEKVSLVSYWSNYILQDFHSLFFYFYLSVGFQLSPGSSF